MLVIDAQMLRHDKRPLTGPLESVILVRDFDISHIIYSTTITLTLAKATPMIDRLLLGARPQSISGRCIQINTDDYAICQMTHQLPGMIVPCQRLDASGISLSTGRAGHETYHARNAAIFHYFAMRCRASHSLHFTGHAKYH